MGQHLKFFKCCLLILLLNIISIIKIFPQTPSGYKPTWGQVIPDTTVVLKWNPVTGASSYDIQVSTDILFTSIISNQTNVTTDTIKINGLSNNQDYFWRVSVNTGPGSGNWSTISKFTCFTPKGLSNLTLWLDANKGITLSGQYVTAWQDQSGKGYHVSQSNSSYYPKLVTNAINGLPSVSFDGTNDYLTGSAITNLDVSSLSLFTFLKGNTQSSGSSNAKSIFSIGTTATGLWLARNYLNQTIMFYNKGVSLISNKTSANSGFSFRIFEAIKNYGASVSMFQNGGNTGTSTNTTITGAFTNTNFCLGGSSSTSGAFLTGEISEMILTSSALSVTERQKVERYLSDKYDKDYINLGKDIILTSSVCDTSITAESGFSSYLWSTGATTSSISAGASGNYWVSVTNSLGFVSYDTIKVVLPDIKLNFQDTSICYGGSLNLNIPSIASQTGFSYLWSTGSTNNSIQASVQGQYWAKVTDSQGCHINSDTITLSVDNFSATTSLGNDTAFCSGNYLQLVSPGSNYQNYSFLWSGGSTDSTLTITSSGNYWVQVTNYNGCTAKDTINVTITGTTPFTNFTSDTVCAGDSTHFTDLSTAVFPDYVNKWLWDFGDGGISTLQNPSHKYLSAGTYQASLTATTAGGCLKKTTLNVFVNQPPQVSFITSSLNCINNNSYFFNQSSASSGDSITGYSWNFDDPASGINNTSALSDPVHLYTNPGTYNVSLTVFTKKGCGQTVIQPVIVVSSASPAGSFTLVSPVNNFLANDTNITFSWNPSNNAVRYCLELATDAAFTNNLLTFNYLQTLSYTASIPPYPQYYWRVKAYNACSDSTASQTFSLQIFSNTTIPGMSLWFKANEGIVLENVNEVSLWHDFSGNNKHADQVVSSLRPTITNNALNGLPVVHFGKTGTSGSRTYLDFSTATYANGNFSIFAVYKPTAINKSIHYLLSGGNSTSFYGGCHAGGTYAGVDGYGIYDNGAQNARNATQEPINWGIVTHFNNKLYRNGQEASYSLQGTVNNLSLNRIGTRLDFADFFFYGDIAEIITYNSQLNTQQQSLVEDYLRYKYAGPPVDLGPDKYIQYGFCNVVLDAGTRFSDYLWSTGATTSQISVNNGGTYWVSVTDIFGYISKDTINIYKPSLTIKDTAFCSGSNITISSGLSNYYTFSWSNSATTSTITVNTPGDYWLHVSDSLGCSITSNFHISADTFATYASLGPDTSFCSGNDISLVTGGGQAATYLWNDGSSGSSLLITTGGTYSVIVTDSNSCILKDTINLTILGDAPYVDFYSDTVCFGQNTTFTNLSYPIGTTTISSYLWDLGNGDTSTDENPLYSYALPGTYNVSLTATTNVGCSKTKSSSVIVYPLPIANFKPTNGCNGQIVSFEDLSSVYSGNITSWYWEFYDPYTFNTDTSHLQNPVYTFDSTGVFPVTLTVTNANGCSSSITKDITVRKTPPVDFSSSPTCFGEQTYFSDITPVDVWEPILSWDWDFGDGVASTISNPVHLYDSAKTYMVTLTVKSINGCTAQITKGVTVNSVPTAGFSPDIACKGLPVQFADNSNVSGSNINSWLWTCNNNIFSASQNPFYVFPDTGSWAVTLTVGSEAGCSNKVTKNISVSPIPIADFSFTPEFGIPPLSVEFTNNSAGGDNVKWNFGDGYTSDDLSPTHIYTDTGYYVITLVTSNNSGCNDTIIKNIYVIPFTVDIAITNAYVTEDNGYLSFATELINLGTINIREININIRIKGGIEFTEVWDGILAPGESLTYQFNSKYKLSPSVSREYVCFTASIPGFSPDNNPENDESCVVLKNDFYLADLYPNPVFANDITAEIIIPEEDNITLKVFNSTGQETGIIYEGNCIKGVNRIKINTDLLKTGVYAVKINYRDKTTTKTFVKE